MATRIYDGTSMRRHAARISFYNIFKKIPTDQTPIIYDIPHQAVMYASNGGYAGHSKIYDWMEDKGWDMARDSDEAHGYYYPQNRSFEWYGPPYYQPNSNLEQAFLSGIDKSMPEQKTAPMPSLANLKWAPAGERSDPTNQDSTRPVIYWVNKDTVYLGRPGGWHTEVYDVMEDEDDWDDMPPNEEIHGYFNWNPGRHDLYWYEPGQYDYQVNRKPTPEEEQRIKATIFNALNIPWEG